MSMDVKGKAPTSPEGVRFSRSAWDWRGLWIYVCRVGRDIITEPERGEDNSGYGLDEHMSKMLAERLQETVEAGKPEKFEVFWNENEMHRSGYQFNPQDVPIFTTFLRYCGGFEIR